MFAITPTTLHGAKSTAAPAKTCLIEKLSPELVHIIFSSIPGIGKSSGLCARACKIFKEHLDTDDGRKRISSVFLSRSMFLSENKVTLEILEGLEKIEGINISLLKNVLHLDLSNSGKDNAELQDIINQCKNLETLDLSGCKNLTTLDFPNHENLQKLNLSECRDLTDLALPHRLNPKELNLYNCIGLRTLKLFNQGIFQTLNLGGSTLMFLFGKNDILKELEGKVSHLDLSNSDMNNAELQDIINRCKNLETLDLSGCKNLKTLDLRNQPNLKKLNLSGCWNLTEFSPPSDSKIKELNLYSCRSLNTLKFCNLGNLEVLNLSNCSSLEILDLQNLKYLQKFDPYNCRLLKILELPDHVNFKILDLNGCVSLEMLYLTDQENLQELYLNECKKLIFLGLPKFPSYLQKLNLRDCHALGVLDLRDQGNLQELNLGQCSNLTTLDYPNQPIQYLNLDGCVNLRDINTLNRTDLLHGHRNRTAPDLSNLIEDESSAEIALPEHPRNSVCSALRRVAASVACVASAAVACFVRQRRGELYALVDTDLELNRL